MIYQGWSRTSMVLSGAWGTICCGVPQGFILGHIHFCSNTLPSGSVYKNTNIFSLLRWRHSDLFCNLDKSDVSGLNRRRPTHSHSTRHIWMLAQVPFASSFDAFILIRCFRAEKQECMQNGDPQTPGSSTTLHHVMCHWAATDQSLVTHKSRKKHKRIANFSGQLSWRLLR